MQWRCFKIPEILCPFFQFFHFCLTVNISTRDSKSFVFVPQRGISVGCWPSKIIVGSCSLVPTVILSSVTLSPLPFAVHKINVTLDYLFPTSKANLSGFCPITVCCRWFFYNNELTKRIYSILMLKVSYRHALAQCSVILFVMYRYHISSTYHDVICKYSFSIEMQ